MNKNYKRLTLACYMANICMSITCNLPPILFLTFRSMYGISYSMLGFLVAVNFVTQLMIDLVFSFFSHKFNIEKTVKFTPVLTFFGLGIYASWPLLFPGAVYPGLLLGTAIFSASSGLCEVLISPVIAAIPSDDPDREMSKLHSVYAWGVVGLITVTSLFILSFGTKNWQWLTFVLMMVPLIAFVLFSGSKVPKMQTPERISGALTLLKNKGLWLSFFAIFLGGASECTMSQWASSYLEQAVGVPKLWGDILGVALFALMLGLGRSLYAKIGKNIERVLFYSAIGSALCYFITAISVSPILGLVACALTGFCVSMLWPGNLIVASDRFPAGGVFIYAMMAAGGDLGASVGPQMIGLITDTAMLSSKMLALAEQFRFTPEQFGMRLGLLIATLFPLIGIPVYRHIGKQKQKDAEFFK